VTFLEAHRLVQSFRGGTTRPLRVALSGLGEPLAMYLKAAGAMHGVGIEPSFLPFNTLAQHFLTVSDGTPEVYLLLPWDLAPELDWRSGIPSNLDEGGLLARALETAESIRRRGSTATYLAAPVPPVFSDHLRVRALEASLTGIAARIGAVELPRDVFSMASYFGTGVPIAGRSLGAVALALVERALKVTPDPAKVLVTDLDDVMWAGVVAEDGVAGIEFGPHGSGYRHFVYQTLLARLKSEGVVLAAVSRNDPEVALSPFRTDRMVLKEDDFVAVVASYNAKSVQVAALADQLNLGVDSFVFVDDSEVELMEVGLKLPAVRRERFPSRDEDLPQALNRISDHFSRPVITPEDRERTAMYRRRLESMVPSEAAGADLRAFLQGLEMSLVVHDRSNGDRTRAVQLINKTSQFNINGRRVSDEEVAAILGAGGRLFTGTLADRNGSHGEVLAILLDVEDSVRSFVMSCRVFNRRAEFAFLHWLAGSARPPRIFEVAETPRNQPARMFLAAEVFAPAGGGRLSFDSARFLAEHTDMAPLFRLVEPWP
jgi:FkbH-like protein